MKYRIIRNGSYIRDGHTHGTNVNLLNVYIHEELMVGDIVFLDNSQEFWEYIRNDRGELDTQELESEDVTAKLYDLILAAESCPA
jgi:hypothetical protein